jgi:hypothetical protein
MSLLGKATKAVSTVAGAATAFNLLVSWEGQPLKTRGQKADASIKLAGLTIFTKTADGKRTFAGFALRDLK